MIAAKPILKYPGAKWRLAPWLHAHAPRCLRVVEPYCGSAAFALTLPYRPEHLVLNDQDQYINLLFRCLRERAEELIRAVTLTPWSRAEYMTVTGPSGTLIETGEMVEDSRRFLVATWQAHGTTICTRNGWRHKGHKRTGRQLGGTYEVWQSLPERLAAVVAVLKDAEIECRPASEIIQRYATPDTLIYADPPYVRHTAEGHRKRLYRHEMTDAEHIELLDVLSVHPGPVLLSGYRNDLYTARLTHWHSVERRAAAEKGNSRTEVLWLNEHAAATRQMRML
jgi:DNA adenine methylase